MIQMVHLALKTEVTIALLTISSDSLLIMSITNDRRSFKLGIFYSILNLHNFTESIFIFSMIFNFDLIFLATFLTADRHPSLFLLASFLLINACQTNKVLALEQNRHIFARKLRLAFTHAAF